MRGVTISAKSSRRSSLKFQPALPMRGVTYVRRKYYVHSVFQPALPMRGVTQFPVCRGVRACISTRTPHAGSDTRGR